MKIIAERNNENEERNVKIIMKIRNIYNRNK